MKLRKTLALLALVAGGLLVQPVAMAEGWFNDLDDAKEATLGELLRHPRDYVDVPVKLEVYFDQTASTYNPYYTRFSDSVYGNVAVWPIDARLYEKRDFGRSYPFFFVQRMSKKWRSISSLSRITPIEVIVVVREIFRGQPWIEILNYKTISKGLRAKDVQNLVRGDAYMRTAQYDIAVASYRKVNEGRAPVNVRVDIYRKRADAHFYAGDYRASVANYRAALRLFPRSRVLEQGHAAAKDMAERKRKPELARERAYLAVAPAPSHMRVNAAVNGVDAIIAVMEDPATVKAQVERDRLDMEKRAARIRDPGAVTVSGTEEEVEAKEATVEDGDEDGVVVKDGVVEEEEGCGEETADESDESAAPADGKQVEEEGVVEEETDDGVKVEEVEEPAEEGCGETVEDDVEEGCAEEVTESQETEEVVVDETGDEELTKDNEVRSGEILVQNGEPVVPAEAAEEESEGCGEIVEEGCSEEATEDAKDDENVEEGCAEESTEDAKDDENVEEGCAEESTEDAKDDETVEEGCSEEATEDAKDDENVEEGCAEESTEDAKDDETVEEGCAEESTEDAKDDETVEEGCAEEVDESQEAEEVVVEETGDVVVEDGEVETEEVVKEAVPVRKTVDKLPRLPFFGCEGVSEAQLRTIIEEVLNNPEF